MFSSNGGELEEYYEEHYAEYSSSSGSCRLRTFSKSHSIPLRNESDESRTPGDQWKISFLQTVRHFSCHSTMVDHCNGHCG